jgi:hypothetical protein
MSARTSSGVPAILHVRGDQSLFRATYAADAAQQNVSEPSAQITAEIKPMREGISWYLLLSDINQTSAKQDMTRPETAPIIRAVESLVIVRS